MNRAMRRQRALSSRGTAWALTGPVAVMCVPAIVAFILASNTAGPDLYHFTPVASQSNLWRILGWEDLRRNRNALVVGAIASGTKLRALGYMIDGETPVLNNESIRSFILVPEAGSDLLPADRHGDEMIEVELQSGNEITFSRRSLVWVWGALRSLPEDSVGRQPLYRLENARAESAAKSDIPKFFR